MRKLEASGENMTENLYVSFIFIVTTKNHGENCWVFFFLNVGLKSFVGLWFLLENVMRLFFVGRKRVCLFTVN